MTYITELLGMSSADLEALLRFLEILSIFVGGATIIWRMSSMATKFEMIGSQQSTEIAELKVSVEKLGGVLALIATQNERIGRGEERQLQEGKRLDALETRVNHAIDRA